MQRRLLSTAVMLLVSAVLFGCVAVPAGSPAPVAPAASAVSSQPPAASVTVTDQAGQSVTIAQPVRRVLSSYGMASLYVYALGAGDRLTGATFLMSKDEQIKAHLGQLLPDPTTLPDPGGQQEANVEEIAKADPDLILISARAAAQDTLATLGVPIVRFEGETFAKLREALLITGQALGTEPAERATRLVAAMEQQLGAIESVTANTPADQRKRVFVSGTSPLKTAGADMLQSEMVALAGGVNVAQEVSGYWSEVNLEQVTLWDPEVIFTVPYKGASVEAILDSPEWANISAVKNRQVYMLPKYLGPWDTPIPESILGIAWMAGKLFPDTPLKADCEQRTTAFYTEFYDLAVPAADVAELCR